MVPDKFDKLVVKLKDSDPNIGVSAASDLLALGPEGISYLVDEIVDLNKPTRERISELIRKQYSFERLRDKACNDESGGVQLLGISRYPEALEILLKLLKDKLTRPVPNLGEVRVWYVIEALGLLGDVRALPELQQVLNSDIDYKDIDIYKDAKRAIKLIDPEAPVTSKWLKPYNL